MNIRLLFCLAVYGFGLPTLPLTAQEPDAIEVSQLVESLFEVLQPSATKPDAIEVSPPIRTYVQGRGTGTITLRPTHVRLSLPIKVVEDTSWDATEKLRQVRQQIVDRATEMNALEGSMQIVGFQCIDTSNQSVNRDVVASRFMAKCFMVADFKLRELKDHEAMIAMSQSLLEELNSVLPKLQSKRRSYSYSTLSGGLTTQQLESPLALFFAHVSEEHRVKTFRLALQNANRDLKAALAALNVESTLPVSIHQNSTYSSTRQSHPVESAIHRAEESLAISIYPDAVKYTIQLTVSANFEAK